LILPDMLPKEKLFYYLKAAALYETILDGKYAGFYDPPLLCDYLKIAVLYEQMGQRDKAEEYVHRIVCMLERHMIASEHSNQSKLLYTTTPANAVSTEQLCQNFLQQTIEIDELGEFRPILLDLQKRYNDYVASQNTKP